MVGTEPKEEEPKDWTHFSLWKRVRKTLQVLPLHFEANISVSGIPATDIFALGFLIGSAIEDNVVRSLNELRSEWDPDGEYGEYVFRRQSEVFPDVRLEHFEDETILMGIELKGWYLLAKEKEPSFRFKVTPSTCAPWDMLVMFPWALQNVLSGYPQIYSPYMKQAKYVARFRNYWWQEVRRTEDNTEIKRPEGASTYPSGREAIEDKPMYDAGNNFGRIARIGIMDDFVAECREIKLSGIEVHHWQDFFKSH